MERARLAGIEGSGELKVVRDATGKTTDVMGVWRLPDDATGGLDPLLDLHRSGERTLYQGPITDPDYPDVRDVELEVVVHGIEAYTYDDGDGDGKTRDLVKIVAQTALPYEGEARKRDLETKPILSD